MEEVVRVDVDERGGLVLTADGAGRTRWFTHDERGLVERFPQDDPALPLAARLRETRGWRVLAYRPGRRMVVLAERDGRAVVLKGHKRARAARAAARHGLAEGAMGRGAFRVPRLLHLDGEHETLVFEHLAAGEVELGAESAPLYARLGERLGVFQADEFQEAEGAADLVVFGPRDELAVLAAWERKVRSAAELPAGWEAARSRLAEHSERLPEPRLGPCHRDLHDRQVHLLGADVVLFDFDLLCRADVALDPGNLAAHLRWRALQGLHGASAASARALEAAFRAGLERARDALDPLLEPRLAFYTASALLRLALVYRLRPRWSARVTGLVAAAEHALDDLAPIG
jgi:hypothetical protein